MSEEERESRTASGSGADSSAAGRFTGLLRRAWRHGGYDREMVLLIVKSAAAACVAWVVADSVLRASSPAFAPFSAVLMVQATVYQSVAQSLRYVLAVALGVLTQAALGFLLGVHLWTFALLALAALALGRWRRLGAQGTQVATAAFFAYGSFTAATQAGERLSQLGMILLLVLVGCAVGVVTNLVVIPPMRYRGAVYGVTTLARAMHDLIGDIHPTLREGEIDQDSTASWWTRARRMGVTVEQARAAVHTARESLHLNPRRLLLRERPAFEEYLTTVDALGRATEQLSSITRGLDRYDPDVERTDAAFREFVRDYGEFLAAVQEITGDLGALDSGSVAERLDQVDEHLRETRERHRRLVSVAERSSLDLTDHSQVYGILLVDASRLLEEFQRCRDALAQAAGEADDGHAGR